jgi:hypothetical protein
MIQNLLLLAALAAPLVAVGEPLPDDPLECPPSRTPDPGAPVPASPATGAEDIVARLRGTDASAAAALISLLPESEWSNVQRFPIQPRVLVDGERKAFAGPAFLVERGKPVNLSIEFEIPFHAAEARSSNADAPVAATTVVRKVIWRGGENDRFSQASDGNGVFRTLSTDGRASDVAVEVAELHIVEGSAPILFSGTSALTLIPGLLFDRSGAGQLEDYPIGVYPSETATGAPSIVRDHANAYAPPRLFYRIDESTGLSILAPHVSLVLLNPPAISGEEGESAVRYIAFDKRMERFWSAFNQIAMEEGLDAHGLRVLRGYVSPNERARLARQGVELSEFSRHLYGDAVAIVLDNNRDTYRTEPRMGDLNKDGRGDLADVEILAAVAEKTMKETGMWGGVGICSAFEGPGPSTGSPYLHIDLRGWHVPFREE